MITHHPVFAGFSKYAGSVPDGSQVDFIGAFSRREFVDGAGPSPSQVVTDYPPLDEEYFEWIDVLESVSLAQGRYTMLELGAGYGRWAVRAAAAAKQRGIACHLLAVEAEPVHFKWLRQHFSDNGLNPDAHDLVQGVVTDKPGETLFYVGMPDGGQDSAAQWYGQAIAKSYEILAKKTEIVHEGFRVFRHNSGWKSIKVPALTLASLMRDLDRIDLIDMDVQGEELKIVHSAIDEIDRKVRRLHIGTHSHEIEDGLRSTLRRRGWECQFDFACLSKNETPWGPVDFSDGVQSWRNLKFQV